MAKKNKDARKQPRKKTSRQSANDLEWQEFLAWLTPALEKAKRDQDRDFPNPQDHVTREVVYWLFQWWKRHGPETKILDFLRAHLGIEKAISLAEVVAMAEEQEAFSPEMRQALDAIDIAGPPELERLNKDWDDNEPLYVFGEVGRTRSGNIVFTYQRTRWNEGYQGMYPHRWEMIDPQDLAINYPMLKSRLDAKRRGESEASAAGPPSERVEAGPESPEVGGPSREVEPGPGTAESKRGRRSARGSQLEPVGKWKYKQDYKDLEEWLGSQKIFHTSLKLLLKRHGSRKAVIYLFMKNQRSRWTDQKRRSFYDSARHVFEMLWDGNHPTLWD